ncbi:hypothetical protein B0T14DRAFT_594302 [Immersiella caudata]|uniref:Uncharacterized protein n=1 Tax=Immersiella caudata TaxID=314043 RepID=A0AA39U535_9PEZI|nr:hypothetical protein B0T14DRAFT_594302 [Immersiella caudata]
MYPCRATRLRNASSVYHCQFQFHQDDLKNSRHFQQLPLRSQPITSASAPFHPLEAKPPSSQPTYSEQSALNNKTSSLNISYLLFKSFSNNGNLKFTAHQLHPFSSNPSTFVSGIAMIRKRSASRCSHILRASTTDSGTPSLGPTPGNPPRSYSVSPDEDGETGKELIIPLHSPITLFNTSISL